MVNDSGVQSQQVTPVLKLLEAFLKSNDEHDKEILFLEKDTSTAAEKQEEEAQEEAKDKPEEEKKEEGEQGEGDEAFESPDEA